MPTHPLADHFDGAATVQAQIAARQQAAPMPVSDVALTVGRYHPRRLELAVARITHETPTSATLHMTRPGGGDLPPFQAGQYVNLFVAIDGVETSRPFAISSSPVKADVYDLTVRRVPGGRVSNHLLDTVRVGQRFSSTGPMGSFHHSPVFHGDDLVFLAGGSGVAPAMSMIRDIVDNDLPRRMHLIYGSRRHDDVLFREELDRLASEHSKLVVDHVLLEGAEGWTGPTGLITADVIDALAGPLANRMVYVCGPQAMYPFALEQLALLGHPRRRSRFEANGAPARPEARAGWPAGVDPAGEVTLTVQGRESFRIARGRPLLDALEDRGVRVEASCRSGECSLCRVRVVSGEVFNAEEARLRMADHEFGYVHSCVAYALTDLEVAL